jgi:ADP-heptose:LPS heptosyltransferase
MKIAHYPNDEAPLPAHPPDRMLVVQTNRLGDCVLSTPALRALRVRYPDARLDVLYNATRVSGVFDHVPEVDRTIAWEPYGRHAGISGRLRLWNEIRRGRYDAAVCLYAHPCALWAVWAARVPLRISRHTVNLRRHYIGAALCNAVIHQDRDEAGRHEAEYNADLLRAMDVRGAPVEPSFRVPEAAHREADALLHRAGIASGSRLAVLHPGSGRNRPIWPLERFAAVGDALAAAGARVVITGGPEDADLPRRLQSLMNAPAVSLGGQLTIPTLAAVLERAAVFVSVDTGPMHLAAALGTPVAALFGQWRQRSAYARWRPFGSDFIPVFAHRSCPGCDAMHCVPQEGAAPCMSDIPAIEVRDAALALLNHAPHRGLVSWRSADDEACATSSSVGPRRG